MKRLTHPLAPASGAGAPFTDYRDPGFSAAVIAWQRQHGRHALPWQNTRDAYLVWLSEIMLQQTQVAAVLEYYARFLARFPTLRDLAAAPVEDVMAQWSGLGYYTRARNLHRCAQRVVAEYDGVFPSDPALLADLPGIGRSTAAAIAAFSNGVRAAIMDGNVKRVFARVFGIAGYPGEKRVEEDLWRRAEALLPDGDGIEAYTQGLMDLGATVCALRQPACDACPLRPSCVAHAQGQPTAYPVKTRKTRRHLRDNLLLWLVQGDCVWLVQRPDTGVWAGLWSFAEFDDEATLAELTSNWPGAGQLLTPIVHVLTHRDWTLRPLAWYWPSRLSAAEQRRLEATLPAGRWYTVDEALAAGLPTPIRRWLAASPVQDAADQG